MNGVMRFDKKRDTIKSYMFGNVAYELELPEELGAVHSVFNIFLVKKCVDDPSSIVPLLSVVVKDSLIYEEVPIEILHHQVCRLRNKNNCFGKGFMEESVRSESYLESRSNLKVKYLHLLPSDSLSVSGNSSSPIP